MFAGLILLAFLALYLIEAGYFTGLLFAAKRIRGTFYRSLGSRYFGEFETQSTPWNFTIPEDDYSMSFNRPKGCTLETKDVDVSVSVSDTNVTIPVTEETGLEFCQDNKDETWVIFPWVQENFAPCSDGVTVLTSETSPAFSGDVVATPEQVLESACQNYLNEIQTQELS